MLDAGFRNSKGSAKVGSTSQPGARIWHSRAQSGHPFITRGPNISPELHPNEPFQIQPLALREKKEYNGSREDGKKSQQILPH